MYIPWSQMHFPLSLIVTVLRLSVARRLISINPHSTINYQLLLPIDAWNGAITFRPNFMTDHTVFGLWDTVTVWLNISYSNIILTQQTTSVFAEAVSASNCTVLSAYPSFNLGAEIEHYLLALWRPITTSVHEQVCPKARRIQTLIYDVTVTYSLKRHHL